VDVLRNDYGEGHLQLEVSGIDQCFVGHPFSKGYLCQVGWLEDQDLDKVCHGVVGCGGGMEWHG